MASISTVVKFTFTDATAASGKRTINVPFGSAAITADDFTGAAAKISAVYSGFGALGQAWSETDRIEDKIDISGKQ